jgi:hypothetical protein
VGDDRLPRQEAGRLTPPPHDADPLVVDHHRVDAGGVVAVGVEQ